MDEIETRLRETSEACFNCYEAWQKDKESSEAREALIESIHELRKVSSRLEIELAVSERNKVTQKPIPIPPHRDANRRSQSNDGNGNGNSNKGDRGANKGGARRRPSPKKKPAE